MSQKSSQKGFTIIEVVLVLAIAALIFLVVFLAVPALQRSQRDTQRRADVGRLHAAIVNDAGNRQGTLPTVDTNFLNTRLRIHGDTFSDPAKDDYTVVTGVHATGTNGVTGGTPSAGTTYTTANSNIYYMSGAKCSVNGTFVPAGARSFAVSVVLESGGVYCQDS